MHTSPPPPGLDLETRLPECPAPLTDGSADRLVTSRPTTLASRPSATLLAARQLLDEADPHGLRWTPRRGDRARGPQRRHELRELLSDRRAARDQRI